MAEDFDATIEITTPQHYDDKPNIAQNIKGETTPTRESVRLEELHPQLDQVQKVIDALRYYKRVARKPYGDPGFNLAMTHALHFEHVLSEEVINGTATVDEHNYLIELQNILHHHRKEITFQQELEILINKHSIENESNTPDFLLAGYLIKCLQTWNEACRVREEYYKEKEFYNPNLGESLG
jgi:hypothetical protein